MRAGRRFRAVILGVCFAPLAAWGACPSDDQVAAFVADYTARAVSQGLGAQLTLQEGLCAQAKVVRRLSASLGPVVGYKAGLTNPAMQQRLGVDHPVRGVLLRDMLLKNGAEVPAAFGARPFFEADFIVVVKDDGLARATSLRQAAESISHIVPFMELPDLMLDPAVKLTGPALVAINTGARLGVLGEPIPMQTEDAFIDALARMSVTLEQDGVELHRGPGSVIMEHPLNSAMWLARDLAQAGIRLRPGDLLSLGSFLPIQAPKPGSTGSVKYLGLPGDPEVSVRFR
jgi:2-keto-4-pentenoate hydratase